LSNATSIGTTNSVIERDLDSLADAKDHTNPGIYCTANHNDGPSCELCIADAYYFNEIHAQYVAYPAFLQLTGIMLCIILS
jgi:hypothetical protein